MRTSSQTVTAIIAAALLGIGGCIDLGAPLDEDPCAGRPEVAQAPTDLTLAPGETDVRDLEDPRFPVFVHSERQPMRYDVAVSDPDVGDVRLARSVLSVTGRRVGRTRVTVEARVEGCSETARAVFTATVRAME